MTKELTFDEFKIDCPKSVLGPHMEIYHTLTQKGTDIGFRPVAEKQNWEVIPQNSKKYIIEYPEEEDNPAALAHELLHIYLFDKGFSNINVFAERYDSQNSLFGYFEGVSLLGPINNILAHLKMTEYFLQFNFEADSFLQQTPQFYFENEILPTIKCIKKIQESGIDYACHKTIRLIIYCGSACVNRKLGKEDLYDKIIATLNIIDKELTLKLINLFEEWADGESLNNLVFYEDLNQLLQKNGVPVASKCVQNDNGIINAICSCSIISIF